MCQATNTRVTSGNRKLAGKLASTCTTGWAYLVTRGFMPIHTPTPDRQDYQAVFN